MSAARLKDIALAAGVDIGTVSHVLNRRPKSFLLRAETRDRIERIADDLGYCRNEFAASISRRHGKVLAFVTSEMGSIEYTGRIQNGVFDAASSLEYAVTLHHLAGCNEDQVLKKILGWQTAGVVFHTAGFEGVEGICQKLSENGIPYGFVNLCHGDAFGVTTDDRQGILAAMEHLRSCGRRKPAFLSYQHTKSTGMTGYLRCRENAYEEGMQLYFPGQPAEFFYIDGRSVVGKRRACLSKQLARIKTCGIDAVLCISDLAAFKLLQQARNASLKVPQDLHLIGFGDLALAAICEPSLSSIAQDFEGMGEKITRMLIAHIEKKSRDKQLRNIRIPVKLVLRESSPRQQQKGTRL
ncbi:MAG: LacI family transcriptional regulator [Lentisphaerae bacterium]|nr:LacI family transcriptional regulator [Lentisphaerota bacterium]